MDITNPEKQIQQFLKQIIDREGINYLNTQSYKVYKEALKTEALNDYYARLLLITLLAGAAKAAESASYDEAAFSQHIQKECGLEKSAADILACAYLSLFCAENCREWSEKTNAGFHEFCKKQWHFELEAHGVWYAGGVHVDADCYASADLEVSDNNAVYAELKKLLEANPFISAEAIYDYFDEKLDKVLSEDFEDYVTCEEYYPPVAEDYDMNFEYLISEFCKKHGFKLVTYECDGETSDYIPNF